MQAKEEFHSVMFKLTEERQQHDGAIAEYKQVCSAVLVMQHSETSDKGHSKRGQTSKSIHVCLLYRKSPLKEDNLSTKAGPKGVLSTIVHITNPIRV